MIENFFGAATSFNGDISGWDTSSVKYMYVRAIALAVICISPGAHLISRTPTPPVHLCSACAVCSCCCSICLMVRLLCPTATRSPSMHRSQRHHYLALLYLEQPDLLIALSNCNKIAIDDSFNKANNNWPSGHAKLA